MPAFGSNAITCAFARRIRYEPVKGFRLSDRIVSALDRFIGMLSRYNLEGNPVLNGNPGVMARFLFIYPFVGSTDWTHSLNLADYRGPNNPLNFTRFSISWEAPVAHNEFGIQGTGSGNTNCQMADGSGVRPGMEGMGGAAWNRRSHGFYSRTNMAHGARDISASFVEPRNGWTYYQGIHAKYVDGNAHFQLVAQSHPSNPAATWPPYAGNFYLAMGDTLGMIMDNQRGSIGYTPYHWGTKGTTYLGGDNASELGMGYGDGTQDVPFMIYPVRNLSFVFSTKHPYPLNGKDPTTLADLRGSWEDFASFVQQLQVALLREV